MEAFAGFIVFVVALLAFLATGIPVAVATGLIGIVGTYLFVSPYAVSQIAIVSFSTTSYFILTVVPLFILMGGEGMMAYAVASIEEVGIGFLFAPLIHPAMKHAQPVRAELKMRTVFNMLGPLTNPTAAGAQVVGVFEATLVPVLGEALRRLGVQHAFVVHGSDGLDEITTTGPTTVAEVAGGKVIEREIRPADFGLPEADARDLVGGDGEENAGILRAILAGQPGPKRDIVLTNAAAALVAAGEARDLRAGAKLAAQSIDSGKAARKLEELVRFTSQFGPE